MTLTPKYSTPSPQPSGVVRLGIATPNYPGGNTSEPFATAHRYSQLTRQMCTLSGSVRGNEELMSIDQGKDFPCSTRIPERAEAASNHCSNAFPLDSNVKQVSRR